MKVIYCMYKILLITIILISCKPVSDKEKPGDAAKAKLEKLKALQQSDPFTFSSYCNERFSYCVGYPVFFMFPLRETANADGRIFTDKNGNEILRVFGKMIPERNNKLLPLEELYNSNLQEIGTANTLNEVVITEKRLGLDYYIISGYTKTRIFHQKTIVKNLAIAYVILQYDKADKAVYDKLAGKILNSFN